MGKYDWEHWIFSGHSALGGLQTHDQTPECKFPHKYLELWRRNWRDAYYLARDKPLAEFLLLHTTFTGVDGQVDSYYSLWSYDGCRINFMTSDCPYVCDYMEEDENYVANQFGPFKNTIAALELQKRRFPRSSACGGRLSPGLGIRI